MTQARAFVTRVEAICAGDPGARAALRSGLGKPLDEVQRMHRIVVPRSRRMCGTTIPSGPSTPWPP